MRQDAGEKKELANQKTVSGSNFKRIHDWWIDLERFGFPASDQDLREWNDVDLESLEYREQLFQDFQDEYKLSICDPFVDLEDFRGQLESVQGNLKSCGEVKLSLDISLEGKWKNGKRVGQGVIFGNVSSALNAKNVREISGKYSNGLLHGKARVFLAHDDLVLEANFVHGYIHGPVRGFDSIGTFLFCAVFRKGSPSGPAWMRLEGDGFLYGKLGPDGRFTGDDVAYIYSDLETVIRGRFEGGTLVSGRETKVVGCSVRSGLVTLTFSEFDPEGLVFEHWPSTLRSMPVPPLQEDPYERKYGEVRQSKMNGAGDGLFARSELPEGATVAFYNGIRVKPGETAAFRSRDYEIYVDWNHKEVHHLHGEW